MNIKPRELNPKYKIGQKISEFTVTKAKAVESLQLVAYELAHPSGASFAYIAKDDENNTFSVAFKTIPQDSTGVAHILEHTVLCGSKKFPVRDPFFSMIKRSLQNFMNAFTANDWTMYPFSTVNNQDFFNLLDVYLDAAFFANLKENQFLQEGWRYELGDQADLNSKIIPKGIVFNEMKGAMSTEHDILSHSLTAGLFPSGTYRHNSGGDPLTILDLKWEDLVNFYKEHYQPSNAFFYYYGAQDIEPIIKFIEKKVLTAIEPKNGQFKVALEPAFHAPKIVRSPYPATDLASSKHQVVLAWVVGDCTDFADVLLLKLLSSVLLSSSGAPLRKALIESKLGSSLSDMAGFSDDLRQTIFSVGLKGVNSADVPKVEQLIIDSLAKIVEQGIEQDLVESALHQLEFDIKDIDSSGYSQGLELLLGFVGPWLHGAEFTNAIDYDKSIENLKAELSKPKALTDLIEKRILQNKHQLKLELYPDLKVLAKIEEDIALKVKSFEDKADRAARQKLHDKAQELEKLQSGKENIEILPKVKISDIKAVENLLDESKVEQTPNFGIFGKSTFYKLPTNGIVSIKFSFPILELNQDEIALLPSLSMLLTGVGTKKYSYDKLSILISKYTGGISFSPEIVSDFEHLDKYHLNLSLSARCLERNYEKTLELVHEIIEGISFHDSSRVEDLLKQRAAVLKNHVLDRGHSYAGSAAVKKLDPVSQLEEKLSGLSQIKTASQLTSDKNLSELALRLENLGKKLTANTPELMAVCMEQFLPELKSKLSQFKKIDSPSAVAEYKPEAAPQNLNNEVWITATPVSYVAKAYKVPSFGTEQSPALAVMANLIRGEYLHRVIREQGGAYGSMVGYDIERGLFLMLSYRDPNLVKSWESFDAALKWAASGEFSDAELESAIIQCFSKFDRPLSPFQKALTHYSRARKSLSAAKWNAFRAAILKINKGQIVELAKAWPDKMSAQAVLTSTDIWDLEQKKVKAGSFDLHQI